jgi:hypothetical protein
MEEITCKENLNSIPNEMKSLPENKHKTNRHVSVLYGIQYIS